MIRNVAIRIIDVTARSEDIDQAVLDLYNVIKKKLAVAFRADGSQIDYFHFGGLN